MKNRLHSWKTIVLLGLMLMPVTLPAQGRLEDYERADSLRGRLQGLAVDVPERANWIDSTSRFWYRKSVQGGYEFELVDAATLTKKPAFDHRRLADSLSSASGEKYTALKLPFIAITFVDKEKAIEFAAGDSRWRCNLADYTCRKLGAAERRGRGFGLGGPPVQAQDQPKASPDGKWEAFIRNFNVYVRSKEKDKKEDFTLSYEGAEGNYYTLQSILWSPDSKKIVAYRTKPGYHRKIQYIESSPVDQLQPKYSSIEYAKPGDVLDVDIPVLFVLEGRKQIAVDNSLFPNAYDISETTWCKDSRAFTFEYNQRGHQVYRVIEVDAATGKTRSIISEEPKTFFCYSGKKYRRDLQDGKEIIWMSERDGWNHLYLYDGKSGKVKNQITKGNWVVRGVERVDEENKQIWFRASGMYPGKDPYFVHYYRINFDGSNLVAFTYADANHTVRFSADFKYYVDTWSRVDLPPVSELHAAADRKVLKELEHANIDELLKTGWRTPEVFTSLGRDGKTDIWGIIVRPTNFDASKKYPVIENIYAGPQDSFVPKSFQAYNSMQSYAELGFIVVQIDGMGTSNRSKAFHDVCWKNLGDAGFPDRILWHKAVAARYSYYDISKVGIYGTSAGGQSALGAVLFHPEFYTAAAASCGCHDNRMDKIWWNEQWMGWPLGPEYAGSSNVDNAYRLQGQLLLTVGEMDNNVDPASTYQVVNALLKANKTFDLVVFPGQGHSSGGIYGDHKRYDFFVHNLLNVEPPDRNKSEKKIQ
jgi:dipeptidyl aminopeptidase/acylaminoacyl peptidase